MLFYVFYIYIYIYESVVHTFVVELFYDCGFITCKHFFFPCHVQSIQRIAIVVHFIKKLLNGAWFFVWFAYCYTLNQLWVKKIYSPHHFEYLIIMEFHIIILFTCMILALMNEFYDFLSIYTNNELHIFIVCGRRNISLS